MVIKTITNSDEYGDSRFEVEISTNNFSDSVSFGNGEPEDMTLGRDLNDAYSIPNMLHEAYLAGLRGEEISFEDENEEED